MSTRLNEQVFKAVLTIPFSVSIAEQLCKNPLKMVHEHFIFKNVTRATAADWAVLNQKILKTHQRWLAFAGEEIKNITMQFLTEFHLPAKLLVHFNSSFALRGFLVLLELEVWKKMELFCWFWIIVQRHSSCSDGSQWKNFELSQWGIKIKCPFDGFRRPYLCSRDPHLCFGNLLLRVDINSSLKSTLL